MVVVAAVGCNHPEERFGRTWYLDGAGNWGFGVSETVNGLRKAGYKGQVSAFLWSVTMSPVADQVLKPLAGLGAARLAGNIEDYLKRYPGNEVNIIALSAGAGVALRAVEHLKPLYKIHNMVLLAASISSEYDVRPALRNMTGKIYVYYSSGDAMLAGPVRVLGAFGAKGGEDPAGLVGLHCSGTEGRVVNIGWQPRFEKYGWYGSHTSCTSEPFVQYVLSEHIVREAGVGSALARGELSEPGDSSRADARRQAQPALPAPTTRVASADRPVRIGPDSRAKRTASRPVEPTTSSEPIAPEPGPPVYAPPLGSHLASVVAAPVVRPGHPATFLTLSRRDPRFPSRTQFADGLSIRLLGVPGSEDAQIEVRAGPRTPPAVHRLGVETGRRYPDGAGRQYVVTLLRVDKPSQTAWLQIRPVGEPPPRSAKTSDKTAPTT